MPTLAGFLAWVYATMGVPTSVINITTPALTYAFNFSVAIVNIDFQAIPVGPPPSTDTLYEFMVYLLGGSNLINWAQDTAPSTYWTDLRAALKINSFIPGWVSSSADQGTSEAMTVPEFFKNLTLSDLQLMKDPYGRQYLAFAQKYGDMWGRT